MKEQNPEDLSQERLQWIIETFDGPFDAENEDENETY